MSQAPQLPSCIPLPLSENVLNDVIEKAKDWALMHGVGWRSKQSYNRDSIQVAPFCLVPSSFPRSEFNKALELQPILNELMHKVAHDDQFLEKTLATTLQVDDFTAKLYDIWIKVKKEGVAQRGSLGLFRSDYLLQGGERALMKQVEFNTVASSFGGITSEIAPLTRYVLTQLGHADKIKNMPENKALSGLCEGMIEAFDLFGVPDALLLFIVEDVTYNICDQRFHEFYISSTRPDIKVVRKTLTEINSEASLNKDKQLILKGKPVAVVYFRCGYEPAQYPSEKEWEARHTIEKSTAIKCPSIQYQLAGTKKVQQALAEEGALERFCGEGVMTRRVRQIFTGLYSLDMNDGGERAVAMALHDAERFVLKPQREGGGNNVYGGEVRATLERLRHSEERAAYILMERIVPPRLLGYMVRPGAPSPPPLQQLVSELGVFGVIIGTPDKIISNRQVGHMMRTKLADSDEGGVAAGFGALDSPYLVDL